MNSNIPFIAYYLELQLNQPNGLFLDRPGPVQSCIGRESSTCWYEPCPSHKINDREGLTTPYRVTVLKNTEISINYNIIYLKISFTIHSIDPKLRTRTQSCSLKGSITISCIFSSSSTWKSGKRFVHPGESSHKGVTLWWDRHAVRNKRVVSDQVREADAILKKRHVPRGQVAHIRSIRKKSWRQFMWLYNAED